MENILDRNIGVEKYARVEYVTRIFCILRAWGRSLYFQ